MALGIDSKVIYCGVVMEWKEIAHEPVNADSGEWAHEGCSAHYTVTAISLCIRNFSE